MINGAPGSGKSTLARMYVEEHPLALALDVDVVRGMLGGWLDRPVEAGLIARRMTLAMARVQLLSGGDVLVPQYLGRVDFVLELEELSRDVGADFVEIVLLSDPQDTSARFARRAAHPETAARTATRRRCWNAAAVSARCRKCTTGWSRSSRAGHAP